MVVRPLFSTPPGRKPGIDTPPAVTIRAIPMPEDPITRLRFARDQIDRVFGDGYAAAHPDLVVAVMSTATINFATVMIVDALERVAMALVEPEENGAGIVRANELLIRPGAR